MCLDLSTRHLLTTCLVLSTHLHRTICLALRSQSRHRFFQTMYMSLRDDDDDESSDDDDDDDDDEEQEASEDDDEEEKKNLAPADSSDLPAINPVSSAEDTEAFKADESAPTPPRSPRLCRAWTSVRLPPPMATSMEAHIAEYATAPTPPSPPPSPLSLLSSPLSQIPSPPDVFQKL
ncbi:hypothetical protein Tco_0019379 [Tanacetum coccineum]